MMSKSLIKIENNAEDENSKLNNKEGLLILAVKDLFEKISQVFNFFMLMIKFREIFMFSLIFNILYNLRENFLYHYIIQFFL